MDGSERRKFKRLGANFDISFVEVGSLDEQFQSGRTVNVCAGGVYFEMSTDTFKPGNLLKVQLSVPPKAGLLEFGGKVAGFAKVLRIDKIVDSTNAADLSSNKYGIAAEFCRPLRLCM